MSLRMFSERYYTLENRLFVSNPLCTVEYLVETIITKGFVD